MSEHENGDYLDQLRVELIERSEAFILEGLEAAHSGRERPTPRKPAVEVVATGYAHLAADLIEAGFGEEASLLPDLLEQAGKTLAKTHARHEV